jgi:hypothetical protein
MYKPTLNVTDNECSKTVEAYIKSNKMGIHLVPPHNHQVNAAERAIATFKEHFIAGLATASKNCPLQLWDEFWHKVKLSLNLLRFSCRDPRKSANKEVHSPYDINKTPIAPIGTKGLVYDDPAVRASWAPHGTDAFYVTPHPQALSVSAILHANHPTMLHCGHMVFISKQLHDTNYLSR